ncbi:MAG TPA: MBL fold metallo-hydrolase [Patescibacteria group bacterium]|nr:MBL fold metallo-hydrolase [Patescibacteria group bacterium]
MHIQYFGLSSFKITSKDTTIITDPFDKKSGLTPPRGGADIVVLAEKTNPLYSQTSGITGDYFGATDAGEYDTKGVSIAGIPLKQGESWITVYLLESEDIKILNLGHIKDFNIKEEDLESLGDIDILILPVGDNTVLDPDKAAKAVNLIDPRIVIPSHYKIPGLSIPAGPLDNFLKEMGDKYETTEKLLVKKKDLSGDETKVVVLEPLR